MSNHFTGLSLGPPLGDQRLDLCDLYAFQSPADPSRTAIILNANPSHDGFHPDALYRLNIDNDGDCLTDLAFTYVFSPVKDGRQTASIGMSLTRLADLLIEFGATDAINLDGGGSTAMVIRNKLVNKPSDTTGERPVSDAIMIYPR